MTTGRIVTIELYGQVIWTDRHTANEGTIKLYILPGCTITINGVTASFGELRTNDVITYDGEPNTYDNVTPTVLNAVREAT